MQEARQKEDACQIYLRVEAGEALNRAEFEDMVRAAQPAALLITNARAGFAQAGSLVKFAKSQNIAVLLDDDMDLVKQLDADGIHLRAADGKLSDIRSFLGEEKSIGVSCALSRHDSMTMAEQGADYIALGELPAPGETALGDLVDIVRWWNAIFEIPCVAWLGEQNDEQDLQSLVEAGADFVCVDSQFWSGPDGRQRLSRLPEILHSMRG